MPVTLPAHAAAVVPLMHRRLRFLPPLALVIGSAAPDLSYLTGVYGTFPHSLEGMFLYCLPVGLAAYLWAELLLLPLWRQRGPTVGGRDLRRFAVTRGLPRTVTGWLWVVASILIGTATHQLWDGLTHVGDWPERHLLRGARLELAGFSVSAARLLWGASSVVASVWVMLWWLGRYPSMPAAPEPQLPVWPLAAAILAGALFGIVWRTLFPWGTPSAWQTLWTYFWAATRYACVAMTALALADRFGWLRAWLTRPLRSAR